MTVTNTISQTGVCPICGRTNLKFGLPNVNGRRICLNESYAHVISGSSEYVVRLTQVGEIIESKLNLN
jgi:hypothetical protein